MDWPGLLRLALQMGITPSAFWQMSVREWCAITHRGGGGLARAGLTQLERDFAQRSERSGHERDTDG